MTTIQLNIQNELGDLRARWNAAASDGAYQRFRAEAERLSRAYLAALLAGDGDEAERARAAGVKLCNEYYGI